MTPPSVPDALQTRIPVEQVLITDELAERPHRPPNYAGEVAALHHVASAMRESPMVALEALLSEALKLCVPGRDGSAGVSLLDTDTATGERVFRWTALAGRLAEYVGGTTPFDDSPCGICLREERPVLFRRPDTCFTYLGAAGVPFMEGLVLPFRIGGTLAGTIWVVSHEEARPLDAEDVRVMTSLADFTGTVYEVIRARERSTRLFALSSALSAASSRTEVACALVEHGTAILGAAGVVLVCPVDGDGTTLEIVQVRGMSADAERTWHRFPADTPAPLAAVWRSGKAIYLPSRAAWSEQFPGFEATLAAEGHHAAATVPLEVGDRRLGVMGVAFDAPRVFTRDDRELIQTVAAQSAQALERARLYDAERAGREAAESANRAKSDFIAVMSHELRTPLNAIGGYAELMELGIRGPVSDEQREDLKRVRQSQRHLLGLINQVLNLAKLETGSVALEAHSVALRDALAAAEALVAPQAQAHGLTLDTSKCPEDLAASADPEKLRQIMVNLLSNAVKFTDAGGRIDVVCRGEGALCVVEVRDTGIGIPSDKLAAVFDAYFQVDRRLARPTVGTGLGLAISRDLARAMGGDLTVESELGVGSTFTLVLPRA